MEKQTWLGTFILKVQCNNVFINIKPTLQYTSRHVVTLILDFSAATESTTTEQREEAEEDEQGRNDYHEDPEPGSDVTNSAILIAGEKHGERGIPSGVSIILVSVWVVFRN